MIITSSRKPSDKTKSLCRKLSLFFDCRYIPRGKLSLSDLLQLGRENVVLVVGEYHGNPGNLAFYDESGTLRVSFLISETYPEQIDEKHIRNGKLDIEGIGTGAEILSHMLLNLPPVSVSSNTDGRILSITPEKIDFLQKKACLLRFHIKGIKTY